MLPQRGKPIPPASGTNNGRIDAPGDRPRNVLYTNIYNLVRGCQFMITWTEVGPAWIILVSTKMTVCRAYLE